MESLAPRWAGREACGLAPAIADKLFGGYDENVTDKQGEIQAEGNDYLRAKWPELDYVKTAVIVGEPLSPDRKAKGEGGESKAGKEDSGDQVVLGVVVAILGVGAAMLFLTRKKDAPAPAPKAPVKEAEAAAPAKKKKKKSEEKADADEAPKDDA